MTAFLAVAFALLAAFFAYRFAQEREARKRLTYRSDLPIRSIRPDELDPVFTPGAYGPTVATEVAFIGRGPYRIEGGTSDGEAWLLAVLAKQAHTLFEFGTCTGKTAYLWARNAPDDARIVTLTLPPQGLGEYRAGAGDDPGDGRAALTESAFERFLYSDTPQAGKVTQLFGDSKSIDLSPWKGQCDLVFVDGSHGYSYVKSDSERAVDLVRPGGIVLWHDYVGRSHSPGVFQALNELAQRLPLARIAGTSIVAYRRPTA